MYNSGYRMYNKYRVMRLLLLQHLETRLDVTDLVFLHNLVNGAIDRSALLAKIDLRIPRAHQIYRPVCADVLHNELPEVRAYA